jgi:hypothetical protein
VSERSISLTDVARPWPLRSIIGATFGYLPILAAGALIVLTGYLVARITRAIVTNLLQAVGFDRLPRTLRIERVFAKRTASDVVGIAAAAVILAHAAIVALERLQLVALSQPLIGMINKIWLTLPAVALAVVFVLAGVIVGRIAEDKAFGADLEADLAVASPPLPRPEEAAEAQRFR